MPKPMENAEPNVNKIQNFILESCTLFGTTTAEDIQKVCLFHSKLLLCFDGYISGKQTKQFHLTNDIAEKTQKYKQKVLEWEQ